MYTPSIRHNHFRMPGGQLAIFLTVILTNALLPVENWIDCCGILSVAVAFSGLANYLALFVVSQMSKHLHTPPAVPFLLGFFS